MEHTGILRPGYNGQGLHFCYALPHVFLHYTLHWSHRFTTVEILGPVVQGTNGQYVTNKIKVTQLLNGYYFNFATTFAYENPVFLKFKNGQFIPGYQRPIDSFVVDLIYFCVENMVEGSIYIGIFYSYFWLITERPWTFLQPLFLYFYSFLLAQWVVQWLLKGWDNLVSLVIAGASLLGFPLET